MNDLIKLIEKPNLVNFDQIRISIASPEEISRPGHTEKSRNLKQLITGLLSPKEVDCFAVESLVQ